MIVPMVCSIGRILSKEDRPERKQNKRQFCQTMSKEYWEGLNWAKSSEITGQTENNKSVNCKKSVDVCLLREVKQKKGTDLKQQRNPINLRDCIYDFEKVMNVPCTATQWLCAVQVARSQDVRNVSEGRVQKVSAFSLCQ